MHLQHLEMFMKSCWTTVILTTTWLSAKAVFTLTGIQGGQINILSFDISAIWQGPDNLWIGKVPFQQMEMPNIFCQAKYILSTWQTDVCIYWQHHSEPVKAEIAVHLDFILTLREYCTTSNIPVNYFSNSSVILWYTLNQCVKLRNNFWPNVKWVSFT